MPRADRYISGFFSPGASRTVVRAKVLGPVEAASLSSGLQADAADLYYSAWISFLDGLHGINRGFYTWATVKLYYSVFYAFRSSLAHDDVCEFHVDGSHYTVIAQTGATPVSCVDRGTHKTVLKSFQRLNPTHALVSQQIDLVHAVDWLMQRREEANYGHPRFNEPDCRPELEFIAAKGVRQTLNAYLAEPSFDYVFDPDHAMVAYPLRALQLIGNQLMAAAPGGLGEDEKAFLRTHSRDTSGSLSVLLSEMKRLTLFA